jgi:hypothetical protein
MLALLHTTITVEDIIIFAVLVIAILVIANFARRP